ncbi:MAG: 5-deoxy-glucuronate isomerase [Pseudomonadota bacterium]
MSDLLVKPNGTKGKVLDITPSNAKSSLSPDWSYVGFGLYRLSPGDSVSEQTGDREVILVLIEGKAEIKTGNQSFGELGERMSVFERTKPGAAYIPNDSNWSATATTACTLAVCTAPGKGGHKAKVLDIPDMIDRGKGANTRHIYMIAMEDQDVADSLLVTEVWTPQGNWSSYPPHRHDEDDFPRMTYLEETYYHRLAPEQGFSFQRVYTDDKSLDETMAVSNHDVVLVPKGHHPAGAPYGYDLYYLNVMAGPLRKWRFENDPDHDWLAKRDA